MFFQLPDTELLDKRFRIHVFPNINVVLVFSKCLAWGSDVLFNSLQNR